MSKVLVINVSKCSGCYNCQLACKDEHAGNDWSPYAKPQPDIGQFWIKVNEYPEGTIPKVKIHYVPCLCNHCAKASCIDSCPENAIYRREDALLVIDPGKCNGCGDCLEACPYGSIYFNEELKIAQKCTGCAHLLDNGFSLPRCVEACPTDAMVYGEEEDLKDLIEGATVLKPETGLGPRVYYRNIPGKFIAGTLFDPENMEVVIGARCRITNEGKVWETLTDTYGDFWFRDLPVGVYDLAIEAKGYELKYISEVRAKESVNVGDIPLKRK